MSKNKNRARLAKAVDSNGYKIILLSINYPLYWDEGLAFYPKLKKGAKNPLKFIFQLQYREFRTWKYNRKTQRK